MRLVIAAIAAFTIGMSASSTAEATVWPVQLGFNYCWGAQTCAYTAPGAVYFTINQNGTFSVSDGFTGTYTYNAARATARLTYQGGSPIYIGRVVRGCVTNGYMDVGGSPQGSWSGCVQ